VYFLVLVLFSSFSLFFLYNSIGVQPVAAVQESASMQPVLVILLVSVGAVAIITTYATLKSWSMKEASLRGTGDRRMDAIYEAMEQLMSRQQILKDAQGTRLSYFFVCLNARR
jgi:hypothetical protein